MDRKYIQWGSGRHLGGRAGDKLKSLMGVFTWASLTNREIVMRPVPYITNQLISGGMEHMKIHDVAPTSWKSSKALNIKGANRKWEWAGIEYEQFLKYRDTLMYELPDVDMVSLKGLPRVMPSKLYEWSYNYNNPECMELYDKTIRWFRDAIRSSFNTMNVRNTLGIRSKNIVIHIRTGDIARRIREQGYTFDYYVNMIRAISHASFYTNTRTNVQIHSLGNPSMVKRLCTMGNNIQHVSNKQATVASAFKTFLDCDILIPSSSGLSTVACTIKENGHVVLPSGGLTLKHYYNSQSKYLPENHKPMQTFTDMVDTFTTLLSK